ncbi:hypothetical protein [Lentzea aerocolonigenes]|uniref:hypothetical protein n=1 Tax=Lentzea aerocolonigenes TaxID=68170 RepID=UPI000A8A191C|nr:hypothetical protein [Lentzea aerocolonigenes]
MNLAPETISDGTADELIAEWDDFGGEPVERPAHAHKQQRTHEAVGDQQAVRGAMGGQRRTRVAVGGAGTLIVLGAIAVTLVLRATPTELTAPATLGTAPINPAAPTNPASAPTNPNTAPISPNTAATSPSSAQSPPAVQLELENPVDRGDSVDLTWLSSDRLDFAVTVAGEGEPQRTIYVHRNRTATIPVDPTRPYCFQIHGTDSLRIWESQPKAIRGATCTL